MTFRRALTIALFALAASRACPGLAADAVRSDAAIFDGYHMQGAVTPFRDPSIIRQGDTYYVFGTDMGDTTFESLPIRCSQDRVTWIACGSVFKGLPAWVREHMPAVGGLWAPDISFFNGVYHLYYAASTFGSNFSAIGLATNVTLDRKDPRYKWEDHGQVLRSLPSDDFNAIDPNILVDGDGSVWLTYGSFWSGIKQRRIDPATGMLSDADKTVYSLAARPDTPYHPIEASSLVRHGSLYYLFVSFDMCCEKDPHNATYRIMVGRGNGPHGPFADRDGKPMMEGGGTELLAGDGRNWTGPGGQTVYHDPGRGDLIVFHALHLAAGAGHLFVNPLTWVNGWPVIQP